MSGMTPEIVDRIVALGLPTDQFQAVMTILSDSHKKGNRTKNAERQARFRERHKQPKDVTESVTLSVTENVTSPPEVSPIDNHKPLPNPPVNSSLRSESSTTGQNGHSIDLFDGNLEKPDRKTATEAIRIAGETWNETASSLRMPLIENIKPKSTREKLTVARTRDLKADHGLDALAGWQFLMAKIRGSPYLRGEVNGFVCTFDWITKPSNFTKIMEDNYAVRPQKNGQASFNGQRAGTYHR